MMTTPDAAALINWLASRDADCPACRHQLRGIPDPICPECGTPLELGVRAPSVRHSGWVSALIACSMGLGFDVVVVLIVAWDVFIKTITGHMAQVPTEPKMIGATLVPLALLCLGAIVLLWKRRHAVLRLPPKYQIGFGVGAFVLVGIVHGGVGVWLMAVLFI